MKKTLALVLTLLSLQSLATGTLYCESKKKDFVLDGTLGRMQGSPLVGNTYIKINGEEISLERERILNYWNNDDEVKILAIDEDFNNLFFKLETKKNIFGKFKGKVQTLDQKFKVECFFY